MKVKRFDPEVVEAFTHYGADYPAQMEESTYGDYVLASDYDALRRLARDLVLAVKIAADNLESSGGSLPTFRHLLKEWEELNA